MNSNKKPIRIALIQMAMAEGAEVNQEEAERLIREAASGGAQIVCLPELYLGRYFCQTEDRQFFDQAVAYPGELAPRMAALGKELGIVLVVPFFERRAAGVYHNSAFVVDADGEILGLYRKMHIPDDPGFYEKYYFAPGDLGYQSFATKFGNVGVLICWDQWYPEAARLTALQGADVLFYPTAIGWHPEEKEARGVEQHGAWQAVQRGHAVANGCYVAAANRVGNEPNPGGGHIQFWGQSFISGPAGQLLAEASVENVEVLFADLPLDEIEVQRQEWPFLRDRRIDSYGGITERFGKP